ncbi:hypothetical protein M8R20_10560 [Pseudomonas sp. R2.Fl]|nr:hypothetical protein [Pseudomonas sp. R2.Fl]
MSELMQLALGHRPHLLVGDLPRPVAAFLGCHPAVVYLGHETMLHIAEKHPEMKREEFQMMPYLLRSGSYYFQPGRPRSVSVFGSLDHDRKRYMIGLKSAEKGCEVWVETMFRTGEKKGLRRIRGCQLVHGPAITG